jgi:phage recombination protein Bet
MSNEIAKREDVEVITAEKISSYMDAFGIASQLNEGEKRQFIEVATAYNLNPFKREIYCLPYDTNVKKPDGTWGKERKLSIITGYETYLKRAERTGKMDGWQADIEGSGEEMAAVVTIYRKDWSRPFIHKAYWSECKQLTYDKEKKVYRLNAMWEKMGKFMLKKVATAQAFRLCFPDEFAGMPYAADELPDNMTAGFNSEPKNITSETPEPQGIEQPKPAEQKPSTPPNVDENGEVKMVQPGEQLKPDHWFWKIPQAQRASHMPEGYWYLKIDGVWTCAKKAA